MSNTFTKIIDWRKCIRKCIYIYKGKQAHERMNSLEFQNSPCISDKNSLDQFPLARQVYARVTYRSCLHEETNAQPTNGFRWTLARTYTTNISPRNHEFNTIGFELAKYIAWPVCQQPPPETRSCRLLSPRMCAVAKQDFLV